tara:strand:+ start:231 stop:374 length:144 start_codon:yes stop_codon:yes gene_type:complete
VRAVLAVAVMVVFALVRLRRLDLPTRVVVAVVLATLQIPSQVDQELL